MRLIDADELKNILTVSEYPCVLQTALAGIVDTQPTAYDVDKVLEQFEAATAIGADCVGNAFECIPKYMAIEIVKAGGVNAKADS